MPGNEEIEKTEPIIPVREGMRARARAIVEKLWKRDSQRKTENDQTPDTAQSEIGYHVPVDKAEEKRTVAKDEITPEPTAKPEGLAIDSVVQDPETLKAEASIEKENLRPAPRLLFHATPQVNFEGIKQNGLLSIRNNAVIGDNLGYSLHFAEEHAQRSHRSGYYDIKMEDRLNMMRDDFVLTIWSPNDALKRASKKKDEPGYDKSWGRESITVNETRDIADVNRYYSADSRNSPFQQTSQEEYDGLAYKDPIKKVPPEHLMAAVPLDRPTREVILKQMILAQKGEVSADQMEEALATYLQEKPVYLAEGVELPELVHALTVSIEKSLIRAAVTCRIEKVKQNQPRLVLVQDDINEALRAIVMLEDKINDPGSARYLLDGKSFLIRKIQEMGQDPDQNLARITQEAQERSTGKRSNKYFSLLGAENSILFWGSTNTEFAQHLMQKKLGMY